LWRLPEGTVWPDKLPDTATKAEIVSSEIEVYQKGYSEGIRFILTNPIKSMQLSLKKLFFLWRPPYYQINFAHFSSETIFRIAWFLFDCFLLLFTLPVIFISIKENCGKWLLFHFWILFISAVCALTYYETRYRLPLVPALIIFTAFTFNRIINHIKEKGSYV